MQILYIWFHHKGRSVFQSMTLFYSLIWCSNFHRQPSKYTVFVYITFLFYYSVCITYYLRWFKFITSYIMDKKHSCRWNKIGSVYPFVVAQLLLLSTYISCAHGCYWPTNYYHSITHNPNHPCHPPLLQSLPHFPFSSFSFFSFQALLWSPL